MSMDVGQLKEAASSGDIEFLKKAVDLKQTDYFLSQFTPDEDEEGFRGNIFHFATWNNNVKFLRQAMEILPIEVTKKLLSQSDQIGRNPLHVAVLCVSNLESVEVILRFCKSQPRLYDDNKDKPWLGLDPRQQTPLHVLMDKHSPKNPVIEKWAMEILSMDMELLCGIEDKDGSSPLFLAVQSGYSQVAEKILMSSSYSVRGKNGSTPLHFAPKCSENVLKLLLEKHLELMSSVDDKGYNVLHQWAELAEIWPINWLLEGKYPTARTKVIKDLICQTTEKKSNDSPLHTATKHTEIGKALVRCYQQETRAGEIQPESMDRPPWRIKNTYGNTPLMYALSHKNEELALCFLSLDSTFLCQTHNNAGEYPFFRAVASGCGQVVEEILSTQEISYGMIHCYGETILHFLWKLPENIGMKLLGKFWWINNLRNPRGRTALHCAIEKNIPWLIHRLRNPSLIPKEPFDWITACERGEKEAVIAFVYNCDDVDTVWRKRNDTPLHHIKLQTYNDYVNFLKIPSIAELKNTTDVNGATPLHRALERKDMYLAKALLVDNGVERNIQDYHGITAMNLLARVCKENDDWAKMCKQIKVNPYLKTTYIQPGTDMHQMRNTLSVVAALLATITFAAGFTLPGGLNNDTGNAILSKKAAFIVFLLSDSYAMCTSMLVLFCLIWSMVSARDMSYLLVDRSVWILMQALYGTMIAFMTGVYVVIAHSSLWAAIIIFLMCSLIGISANKTVLHNVLAKLIPAADQDREDRYRMLEEGRASDSRKDNSQYSNSYAEEELLISTGNQEQGDHNSMPEEETTFNSGNVGSLRNRETSSKPVQDSNSFVGNKMLTTERYQNRTATAPLLEKGEASTSYMMTHRMSSENVAIDLGYQPCDGERHDILDIHVKIKQR